MSRVEKFGRGSENYVFYMEPFTAGGVKEVFTRRFFHPRAPPS